MAELINLKDLTGATQDLSILRTLIPGSIKRVFYIYGAGALKRGGHRHHETWNVLICLKGECRVYSCDGEKETYFTLDKPSNCLVLEPRDWHIMDCFSGDAILLVLANQYYDRKDYIDEPYAINIPQVECMVEN